MLGGRFPRQAPFSSLKDSSLSVRHYIDSFERRFRTEQCRTQTAIFRQAMRVFEPTVYVRDPHCRLRRVIKTWRFQVEAVVSKELRFLLSHALDAR